jgi:hypothetical protein
MTEEGWLAESLQRKNAMENRFQGLKTEADLLDLFRSKELVSATPESTTFLVPGQVPNGEEIE